MNCVKCILCPEAQSQMQKNALKEKNAQPSNEAEAEGPIFTETSCAKEAGTAAAPAVSPCAGGTLSALM